MPVGSLYAHGAPIPGFSPGPTRNGRPPCRQAASFCQELHSVEQMAKEPAMGTRRLKQKDRAEGQSLREPWDRLNGGWFSKDGSIADY